jgi:ferredoxin-NADP reductase
MIRVPTIRVRVAAAEMLTPAIRHISLVSADGSTLPPFAAGSHIQLTLEGEDGHRRKNAYSLVGTPDDLSCYRIAVLRIADGRGGSIHVHDKLHVGSELEITYPLNLFPIAKLARKHVLIAGGIGITPFMSHLWELDQLGAAYELHYAMRSRSMGAFLDQLQDKLGSRLTVYPLDENRMIEPDALLGDQPLGTHAYVCGPPGLIEAVEASAERMGWPARYFHSERFGGSAPGKPFQVVLAKTGATIEVAGDTSLLDAIEASGYEVQNSCRGGVCGQCETAVLEGEPEHLDHVLSAEQKACGKTMMVCVSRAKGDRLVLDL